MSLIPLSRIRTQVEACDWRDAIKQSAQLLVCDGIITAEYVAAIFESFDANGNYMIIVPGVAIAHARPEKGALSTGLSLVTLRSPAIFDSANGTELSVIFTLAATSNSEHLEAMQTLAELLMDDKRLSTLKVAETPEEAAITIDSATS